MSTPDETTRSAPKRRWLDVAAYVLVPVAAATVFVAVLLGERVGIDEDLQIVAPASVGPGDSVALRSMLFTKIGRPQGAELVDAPVRVRLLDGRRELAATTLTPSANVGMEGVLRVPDAPSGRFTLLASASFGDGRQARVEAPLTVEHPPRPVGEPGRSMHPLQRWTLFPIQVAPSGEPAPASLELRVPGGACVPEQPCEVLVRVGAPAAQVALEPTPAITVQRGPMPSEPTDGIVSFVLVTHGPDVTVEVVASRDGAEVARRQVRLPIMLGGFAMRLGTPIAVAGARPTLAFEGAEPGRGIIVDAYRDGVWQRTGSIADTDSESPVEVPFDGLEQGIWHVQARTDPWDTNAAAVRYVAVVAPGTPDSVALAEAARWVLDREYDTDYARVAASSDEDPARALAYLFALPELDVLPQPQAMSGHMQATWGIDERRAHLRWGGAGALLLLGLFVMAVVLRRGLGASAQARAVLLAAGDADAQSAEKRRRMTLTVVAVVAALALAFVAAAMMVVARG